MEENTENTSIRLVDNTAPLRRVTSSEDEDAIAQIPTTSTDLSRISKRWRTPSVRASLRKRKYAKWQPDRLGLTDTSDLDAGPGSCDEGELSRAGTNNTVGADSLMSASSYPTTTEHRDIQSMDFASSANEAHGSASESGSRSGLQQRTAVAAGLKPGSQLDILYENQRGWFFFGVPLYSHSSLLNFDPSAWVTGDQRDSPVNITNAQLPDPSWKWAWKNWYVDMSGDVDDQGWQYSFSFSSSAWHGSHPWFHSFVRRRRWVRLRVKRAVERGRRGQTEFEMAHRLNADYFTIHSASKRRAASVADPMSRVASARMSRATTRMDQVPTLEEVASIPALLHAMKTAVVDREKIDSLDRFLHEGGYELYYLDEKMPEIMSLFVFQASRWQFLTHLTDFINELSREESRAKSDTEVEDLRRRKGYLVKAAETASHHLTGPEIFNTLEGATEMLNLTPVARKGSLMSKHSRNFSYPPMNNGGHIKGISSKADIGREGHIY